MAISTGHDQLGRQRFVAAPARPAIESAASLGTMLTGWSRTGSSSTVKVRPYVRPHEVLTRCENGHLYDPARHTSCPYCSVPDLDQQEPTTIAWLLVLIGPLRGRQFRLTDTSTIGRAADNCIVLADAGVSRLHAQLCLEDNRFYVSDVSSTGTFVNGASIGIEKHPLRDRDEIRTGNTIMLFVQAVTPEDLTTDAKRRVREFNLVWERLASSVRYDR